MHANASKLDIVEAHNSDNNESHSAATFLSQSNMISNNSTASTALTSSTRETSVLPVPVALPVSGLTLPLALCAVGGPGSINGSGVIQAGNGLVTPQGIQAGGIILLNVPGTSNPNLSALSQIAAGSNQAQQQFFGGNSVNAQASVHFSQQTSQSTVQPLQTSLNNAGLSQMNVVNSNQMKLQTPVVPQGSTTAYMLLPIQQLPATNQSTPVPQLQQATTNIVSISPQTISQDSKLISTLPAMQSNVLESLIDKQQQFRNSNQSSFAANVQEQLYQASTSASSLECTYASVSQSSLQHLTNLQSAAPTVANSLSSTGVASLQQIQANSLPKQNTVLWSTESNTNPVNDPQITSSVPPTSKDLTSFFAPAVMNEIKKLCASGSYEQLVAQNRFPTPKDIAEEIVKKSFPNIAVSSASPLPVVSNESLIKPDCDAQTTPIVLSEHCAMETTSTPPLLSTPSTDPSGCSIQSVPVTVQSSSIDQSEPVLPLLNKTSDTSKPPAIREKRKKGPAPKLDGNEQCLICKDKASGYHYGVLSCEGCKGFFRRSIIKNSNYKCKGDGKCLMNTYMRRKCQYCRLSKCRSAGMKDESVLSEVHGGSKAKRIKKESQSLSESSSHLPSNLSFNIEPAPNLTDQQRNLVRMLQANENRFQWPTQEDVEKVTPWMESGDSHRCRASRFAHFTELAILIVQLVVEFTKQLPGFLTVSREDQILLLKACTIEVMLLRAAKQYDKKTKAINFLNGRFYDKSSFYRAGMQVEFVDPIFDFCNSMAKLNLDEAEYALLVAINTFSADRPNLKDHKKVEAVQDSYVELLRIYLKIHHPDDPLMFPRTLMKLVELRTLNNYHSEQIFALKIQDKQLPPLLAEIWDM